MIQKSVLTYLEKSEAGWWNQQLGGRPLFDWSLQAFLDADLDCLREIVVPQEELASLIRHSIEGHSNNCIVLVADSLRYSEPTLVVNGAYPLLSPRVIQLVAKAYNREVGRKLVSGFRKYDMSITVGAIGMEGLPGDGELVDVGEVVHASPLHQIPKWHLEQLVRREGYTPERSVPKIKLLVVDADGVLNDAGFYYDQEGEALKKYNTRDGAGIKMIQALGVEVGIITGEKSGFTPARANKLGIGLVAKGISNKLPVLEEWKKVRGLNWEEIAYMGDDLPDLPCIRAVGYGACPANAEPELLMEARFVAPSDGGHGCVRDLIRHLMATGRI